MRRKITRFQAICFILLWGVLFFVVITTAKRIDGPVILSLVISAALVFIPVYKSMK
ncbi:MAG TPA: hypothetical protein IAA99_06025 [Candidatus Avibacteroides faecavium]|nr:hypothetical protein [Candidatus Avibacteroides faecavium]